MKWYQVEADIHDLSHEGLGVARLENGKVAFISGALPDERVVATIQRKAKGQLFGRTETILTPSARRSPPPCPHYEMCGGCSMQHLSSDDQVAFKEARVYDNLTRIGKVDPPSLEPTLRGPTEHYRRKARIGVKFVEKKGGVIIGFREKGSSLIHPLETCKALAHPVPEQFAALKQAIALTSIRHRIPQLEIGVGENTTSYILRVLETPNDNDLAVLRAFAREYNVQLFLQPKGLDSITPLEPETPQELEFSIPDFNINFQFKPFDFIQVNADINRQAIAQAIDWLDLSDDDKVVDLFCGLGNFTLPLARHSANVIGIENDAQLIERARANATRNDLAQRAEFIALNLYDDPDKMVPYLTQSDKVLVDPPRSGALEAVKRIAAAKIKRLVYVSCNPATLARDVDFLVNEAGYRLEKLGMMDMFPHTAHIETMALLVKD